MVPTGGCGTKMASSNTAENKTLMDLRMMDLEVGNAICYSGYRDGQSPQDGSFPSHVQVSEDLHILAKNWRFLRLYDCSLHAEVVLEVIRDEAMDFKVMLGANMLAEESNPDCPWGAQFSEETLRIKSAGEQ